MFCLKARDDEPKQTEWMIDSGTTHIVVGKPGFDAGVITTKYTEYQKLDTTSAEGMAQIVLAATPLGTILREPYVCFNNYQNYNDSQMILGCHFCVLGEECVALYLPNLKYNLIPQKLLFKHGKVDFDKEGNIKVATEHGDPVKVCIQ